MIDAHRTAIPLAEARIVIVATAATDIAITATAAAMTNAQIEPPEHHMQPRAPTTTAQCIKIHHHASMTVVSPTKSNVLSPS
jgi:hypothetical protein